MRISPNIIWDNDRTSYKGYDGKYKCIYAGHGTTLCIDKNIYKDYVKYCEIHNKQNHTGFVDAYSTFEKMCIDITNETYITN